MTTSAEVQAQQDAATEAGRLAGMSVHFHGAVIASFEPGDMTRYTVTIVDTHLIDPDSPDSNLGGRYAVASTFGAVYGWTGDHTNQWYVTEKMVTNENSHTGLMLSSFLNGVASVISDHQPASVS